jgi:hypothetical protein
VPLRWRPAFGLGVLFGAVVGLAIGSVLGQRFGGGTVALLRDRFDRLSGRQGHLNFEYLIQ